MRKRTVAAVGEEKREDERRRERERSREKGGREGKKKCTGRGVGWEYAGDYYATDATSESCLS